MFKKNLKAAISIIILAMLIFATFSTAAFAEETGRIETSEEDEPEVLGAKQQGDADYEAYFYRNDGGTGTVVYYFYKIPSSEKYRLFIGTQNSKSYVKSWKLDDPYDIWHKSGNPDKSIDDLTKNVEEVIGFSSVSNKGILKIPECAFINTQGKWSSLKSVKFEGETAGSICDVNEIGKQAFYKCTGLTHVIGETCVETIGKYAFEGCSGLKYIYLPVDTNDVQEAAFRDCTNLQGLCFRCDSLTIGNNAFYNCKSLKYISLPALVDSLGDSSFYNVGVSLELDGTMLKIYSNGTKYYNGSTTTTIKSNPTFAKDLISKGKYYKGGSSEAAYTSTYPNNILTGIKGYIGSSETECTYEITNYGKTVTLSGSGPMIDFSANSMYPWGSSITAVQFSGFSGSIGTNAFKGCTGITSLDFSGFTGSIGTNAFNGCTGITSLNLGTNAFSIGNYAFKDCKIATLTYGGQTLGTGVFDGTTNTLATLNINMGSGSTLYKGVFNGNTKIKTLKVNSVGTIKTEAFSDCTGLTSVTLGTVNTVERKAFIKCSNLTSFDTGNAGTINDRVVNECDKLEEFTLGAGCTKLVTPIKEYPDSIKTITVAAGNAKYKGSDNKNCIIDKSNKWLLVGIVGNGTSFSIPEDVENTDFAFYNMSNLKTVTIPSSVTSIGEYTFSGCTGLTEVDIPSSATKIGQYAFSGCKSMKTITVPKTVTSVAKYAFNNCIGLTTIKYTGSEYEWDKKLKANIVSTGNNAFSKDKVIFAYDEGDFGTSDSLHWKVEGKILTITRNSGADTAIPDFANAAAVPWNKKAATIETVKASGFTEIGDYAFSGFRQIDSDKLDLGTVTKVGNHAFENCVKLSSFDKFATCSSIGSYAFSGCSSLTSVSISGENETIGEYAFNNCTALESFDSGTVVSLGSECLNGCTSLDGITIGAACDVIGMPLTDNPEKIKTLTVDPLNVKYVVVDGIYLKDDAGTLVMGVKKADIPDGITTIGSYAFFNQNEIETVTIPVSVTKIEENAFAGCDGISKVNYFGSQDVDFIDKLKGKIESGNDKIDPSGESWNYATTAGNETVDGGTLHWEITGGDTLTITVTGLTKLPDFSKPGDVFWSPFVSRVTTVVLPDAITAIGSYNFYGFSKLTNANLTAANVTAVGAHSFEDCDALDNVVNGTALTVIGDNAFADCDGLTVVALSVATDIGDQAFADCSRLTTITFPAVENIGDQAFEDCSELTTISFPNTLQSVGEGVLKGCENLGSITVADNEKYKGNAAHEILIEIDGSSYAIIAVIPGIQNLDLSGTGITEFGAQAFSGCENLESITIPDSVKTVSNNAFEGCTKLAEVNIPASVDTIGPAIFSGCTSLEKITVAEGNANYKSEGNAVIDKRTDTLILVAGCKGTTSVPDDVKIIGEGAFRGCTKLTAIAVPATLTEIEPYAFYGCTDLTAMDLPDTVVKIGESAFEGCSGIGGSINIKSLTKISDKTFKGCASLVTVDFPEGLTAVEEEAFAGCYALESKAALGMVKSVADKAFEGCASITEAELPVEPDENGLGEDIFKDCTSLKIVSFTNGIKDIPEGCFTGCSSLMNIRLYYGTKTIGTSAFNGAVELETVQIPVGVDHIYENAFNGTGGNDGLIDIVNFTGSESSWKGITVDDGNDPLLKSKGIVYDYEDTIFPENLKVSPDDNTISIGGTVQLNVKFSPEETSKKFKGVTWSSSDESIATVSNTGLVTAKGLGEATITVKTTSEEIEPMEASARITVMPPLFTVTYKPGFEGVSDKSESVYEGTKISLDPEKFSRIGYHISGWKDDAGRDYESSEGDIVIQRNITFTAQWEEEGQQEEEEKEEDKEPEKEKEGEKPVPVSPNQIVVKKVRIKDSEGNELEIDMNVEISKAVSYNGCKHVLEGEKSGGSNVADLTVKVTGGIEQYASVKKIKVKNNKNASASASKKPQIVITLKPTGNDKAVRKSISEINKTLKKDADMTFEILPLDLFWAKGNLTAKANGKKTKLSKLSYANPSGKTVKLTKKDFSVDSIDAEKGTVTITGKGNCSNTVVLPLS